MNVMKIMKVRRAMHARAGTPATRLQKVMRKRVRVARLLAEARARSV